MSEYLAYIVKASASLAAFYLVYALFMRRSTFFAANRFWLAGGVLLSFIIPLLKFHIDAGSPVGEFSGMFSDTGFAGPAMPSPTLSAEAYAERPIVLLLIPAIYFAGVAVYLFRFLLFIVRIVRLHRVSRVVRRDGYRVVETDGGLSFSFFNTIYIPSGTLPLIVEHEKAHIRQRHWIDLLILETASAALWFNPFVFLCKRSIKLQHEYLADRAVTRNSCDVPGYMGCMLRQAELTARETFASSFFSFKTKNRIVMMTKNRTSSRYIPVYMLSLPLAAALTLCLASFSAPQELLPSTPQATEQAGNNIPSLYPLGSSKIKGAPAPFGERNVNMPAMKGLVHTGMDFAAPAGTNIYATANGTVTESGYNGGWGNRIVIAHDGIYTTMYAHMENLAVVSGDAVTKGQVIGTVGSTGRSTGPHLHYEVHKDGKPVDPKGYLPE